MSQIPCSLQDLLVIEQQDNELLSIDMGITRYKEQREAKERSCGKPELKAIDRAVQAVTPKLQELLDMAVRGHPMRGAAIWGPVLRQLEPEKAVAASLISLINAADIEKSVYSVCMTVASAIRNELKFKILREQYRDVYNQVDYRNSGKWTPVVVREACKQVGLILRWDPNTSVHVGAILIKLLCEHTDYFEHVSYRKRNKTMTRLRINPKFLDDLENEHDTLAVLAPWNMPMVCSPKPWTGPKDGGYIFMEYDLVKRPEWDSKHYEIAQDMPQIYEAVNTLQATPWKINTEILDVAKALWASGGNKAGMPPKDSLALPPLPEDFQYNEESKRDWKRRAAATYDANAALMTARKTVMMQLWIAERFKNHESIYFVWNLDWRGRAYPIGSHLHPQADDLGRSLLRFSNSIDLGPSGFRWLTIHLANCIGWDKMSFDDRVHRVSQHEPEIRRWVSDPLEHRGWMDVDEPFKALAAAQEWVKAKDSGDPSRYRSSLPVAVDGSCNGLQHFSAIGKDPIGAQSTNLGRSERPLDIYLDVAHACNRRVDIDCTQYPPEHPCHLCRGRVSRSLVKRGVMTTPYGVTKFGMQSQLFSGDLLAEITADKNRYAEISMYLRDVIYDAVGEVVVAARSFMDWLRDVAGQAAKEGTEVSWLTPLGFPVVQVYRNRTEREVKTSLQKIKLFSPTKGTISAYKQTLGLPPNFIHSLDATHLMMTVLAAKKAGIQDFGMVHDSYATHAGNMERLSSILRQCFVDLHQGDPIEQFKIQVQHNVKQPLPDLPTRGSFEIEDVLKSPYFFH